MEFNLLKTYVNIEAMIKADDKDPSIVYIEASNQIEDSQQDVVLQKALKSEKDSYLKKGVVSWNHLHKAKNDPQYICGEPLEVAFTNDGRTLVKARMYPSNKYGKSVMNLAKDKSTRLGASIGGYILQRKKELNKSVILKVLWDEVAITHQPINDDTLGKISLMPFSEFSKAFIMDDTDRAESLKKALEAGYGTDASGYTGGRALQQESLMGADEKKKRSKKLTDMFNIVLVNLSKGKVRSYAELRGLLPDDMISFAPVIAEKIAANIDKIQRILTQEEGT